MKTLVPILFFSLFFGVQIAKAQTVEAQTDDFSSHLVEYYYFLTATSIEDYENLIERYSEFIQLDSDNWRLIKLRAEAKIEINDHKGAHQDFKNAHEIKPSEDLEFLIGYTQSIIDGDTAEERRYENLIRSRELVSEVRSAPIFKDMDLNNVNTNPVDLIQFTNEAIRLDPEYTEAFYERGILKMKLKDYRGAINDFDKVIGLEGDFKNTHLMKAYSYHYLMRFEEALTYYKRVIKNDPNSSYAFLNRGILLLGRKFEIQDSLNKGCQDLSRAGELGLAVAYDFIEECCQGSSSCNYYPLEYTGN